MFEIGFTELLLVGTVALLVLGPERLPKAAATAGRWMGQTKRALSGIKQQMERELDAEHLRKEFEQPPLLKLEQELREGIQLDKPVSNAPLSTASTSHGQPAP